MTPLPSEDQLRVKSGKTMVGTSVGKGIAIVAEAEVSGIRWLVEEQHFAARGFA